MRIIIKKDKTPTWEIELKACFNQLSKYKDYIHVVEIEVEESTADEVNTLRKQFKAFGKQATYLWLAKNQPNILTSMGYAQQAIDYIKDFTRFPSGSAPDRNKHGRYSIDHILPLKWGGTNDIKNIWIIPESLNQLKDRIETLQILISKEYSTKKTIKTIVPRKDTNGNNIKFVPDLERTLPEAPASALTVTPL